MMKRTHTFMAAALLAAGLTVTGAAFTSPAEAAKDPVHTGTFSNVAVNGFDAVAYFKQGRPIKGDSDFSTTHNGAEFRFSSKANLDTFLSDPAKYAPQYGGYCAWAVSQGYTAPGDAQYWKIVDGKLYLNFNASVQETWESDISGFVQKADTNWPNVLN